MTYAVGVRGGLSVDHLVDAEAGARFSQLGGPALFGALGARLVNGTQARVFSTLPDDDDRFERLFDELGIDVGGSRREARAMRLWILNSAEGRRIVTTAPAGDIELEGAAAPALDDDGPDPVPVTGTLDGLLDSSPTEPAEVGADVRLGVDPHQVPLHREGIAYLQRVARAGSIVLPSRVQLTLIDADPIAAARAIRDTTGLGVVARLDREGIVVVSQAGEWEVRDPAVRVVETTGAGDSSAAAIVAAWTAGSDLPVAAAFGASAARLALSDWGHLGLLADPLDRPFPEITITRKRSA
ncbi:MAG: PfkB family carbohydrate kinase [Leifsonia sp.]